MHKILTYITYGWLVFIGVMHIYVDVVLQYLQNNRLPSTETTLYWGLNIAYGMGQIVLGLLGLLIARYALEVMKRKSVITLIFFAGVTWLVIGFFFIEYSIPKIIISIFIVLHIATTMSLNKKEDLKLDINKVKYNDLPKYSIRFSIIPYIIQVVTILIRLIYSGVSGNPFSYNSGLFPFIGLGFEIAAVVIMFRSKMRSTGLLMVASFYLVSMIWYGVMLVHKM